MKGHLQILPLGGLGEIGLNMMVVQWGKSAVIVDCGVMFADDHLPGVDLILPDFSYVLDPDLDVQALLLTHGHEDHIGAVPFLLRQRKIPVYGSRFTLALIEEKLREHRLSNKVDLHKVAPGQHVKFGPFSVEFIRMSHSIADALALAITTPMGKVIHTGDFKLDLNPVDGQLTDMKRFSELGKEGVFLLLSDSTNVEIPGSSISESSVYQGLYNLAHNAPGWVILASFASHIPRIAQVIRLAMTEGRKIVLAGRSMIQNVGIARALGYLTFPQNLLIDLEEVARLPRNELIILSTGTQGEPRSALARMAYDQHRDLRIKQGDRVILSSRFIPGNERAIYAIVNHLYRRGAEVFTTPGADVHVSGHAYEGDLEQVLQAVRPRYFVPIHGEYRHLVKHVQLARRTGVPPERALILEDGDMTEFSDTEVRIRERIKLNRAVVDGQELADIASDVLRDRRQLSVTGIVVAVLIVDSHSGEILRGPELFSRGVAFDDDASQLFDEAREEVRAAIEEFSSEARTDEYALGEEIRITIRRFFKNRIDRKPVVIPIVLEI